MEDAHAPLLLDQPVLHRELAESRASDGDLRRCCGDADRCDNRGTAAAIAFARGRHEKRARQNQFSIQRTSPH